MQLKKFNNFYLIKLIFKNESFEGNRKKIVVNTKEKLKKVIR